MPSENLFAAPDGKNVPVPEAIGKAVQLYKAGRVKGALQWCRYVLEKEPENVQVMILAGGLSNDEGEADDAVSFLQKATELLPSSIEAWFLLGRAYKIIWQYHKATECYEKVISLDPKHLEALINLGNAYKGRGKLTEAEEAYRKLLEIAPEHPEAHANLGNLLKMMNKEGESIVTLRKTVELNPDNVAAWRLLGDQLVAQKKWKEAVAAVKKAVELDPDDLRYHAVLADAYRGNGETVKAEQLLLKVIDKEPDNIAFKRKLADFYMNAREHSKAEDIYSEIAEKTDYDPSLFNNRSLVLSRMGLYDEAEEAIRKALEIDPRNPLAFNNAGILMMEMNRVDEAILFLRRGVELAPANPSNHSNLLFNLNYTNIAPAEMLEEHDNYNLNHIVKNIPESVAFTNSREKGRKLKIGYVSPDFCGHVVTYFIEGPLKEHDKEKFEVYLYANVSKPDGVTQRLKTYEHYWRSIIELDDEQLIELIRQDGIDILVDLAGHTGGNRLTAFAYRPAPIQATWIGYPNTTGVETIDYRFVDDITDPPGNSDDYHVEKLERLPSGFNCYMPPGTDLKVADLPVRRNGFITFGSFNNLTKVIPSVTKVWANVLKAVPNSRLFIKAGALASEGVRQQYKKRFEACGVNPNRLILMGKVPNYEDHTKLYGKIDICLDAFPFNGATTTCEALWMGCPVMTIRGGSHSARVSSSVLTRLGLKDLIGEDAEDFVAKAAELAADVDALEKIRIGMRERIESSTLTDAKNHAREVEAAYNQWWKTWCEENPE